MSTSNTIRAAVLAVLGAAEECGKASGGSPAKGCNAWTYQRATAKPTGIEGDALVEAVIAVECRERQNRHAMHVQLHREDEHNQWIGIYDDVKTDIPGVGRHRSAWRNVCRVAGV
ncbi:hypothetical protein GCM10010411_94290 [Actinomadura fulvescens]|uniref:Uncharacterized protein n=2 Tax=Actinomadura fulvescens TaxID=46160 RepID=A0ABP6DCC9_9ACTN